jgi:hypothetical protein
MRADRQRHVLKLLRQVREEVANEIRGNASRGGVFSGGLSNEGYAGGYLQAIDDVEAALSHGHPGDPRGYWRLALSSGREQE